MDGANSFLREKLILTGEAVSKDSWMVGGVRYSVVPDFAL